MGKSRRGAFLFLLGILNNHKFEPSLKRCVRCNLTHNFSGGQVGRLFFYFLDFKKCKYSEEKSKTRIKKYFPKSMAL